MKYKVSRTGSGTVYTRICSRCECVLTYAGSFAQKYCLECGPIVEREKARERMRRYRARMKERQAGLEV